MRYRGTIIRWNDERGFGFVRPANGSRDVFFHFSALRKRFPRPSVGDLLEYDLSIDESKGPRAVSAVLFLASGSVAQRAGRGGFPERLLAVLVPALWLGAAIGSARRDLIPDWVAVLYVASSSIAFGAYAVDKFCASRDHWRISEGTLHLLEMAGGWPGAFAAQQLIRHKNRKWQFQLVYWLIVAAHLAFWSWFVAKQRGWIEP